MKRILIIGLAFLMLCMLLPALASCDKEEPYIGDYIYEEDSDGNDSDDDYSHGDYDGSDDNSNSAAGDGPLTEDRAYEIHAVFKAYSFDEYYSSAGANWSGKDDTERTAMFDDFFGMASDLGIPFSVSEEEWIENMDWYGEDSYSLWYRGFSSLSFSYTYDSVIQHYVSVFQYVEGLEAGEYDPLHPEILAVADSLTIEYYADRPMLCLGGVHNISQIFIDSMNDAGGVYYESGSVTAVEGADIFGDDNHDYSIEGGNGVIDRAEFGDTDLVQVFRAIGAIDDSGEMQNELIQISAISVFNAPILFVLTQDAAGLITFAPVRYSDGAYDWDGEVFTTIERTCFSATGAFCYIDGDGSLRTIS